MVCYFNVGKKKSILINHIEKLCKNIFFERSSKWYNLPKLVYLTTKKDTLASNIGSLVHNHMWAELVPCYLQYRTAQTIHLSSLPNPFQINFLLACLGHHDDPKRKHYCHHYRCTQSVKKLKMINRKRRESKLVPFYTKPKPWAFLTLEIITSWNSSSELYLLGRFKVRVQVDALGSLSSWNTMTGLDVNPPSGILFAPDKNWRSSPSVNPWTVVSEMGK